MTDFTVDSRLKFSKINIAEGTGSISIEIFGGPLARVQAAVFDGQDKVQLGVGFDNFSPPLTTETAGKTSWLFNIHTDSAYIKWGIQAVRSAANLGAYSVTAKVRNAEGGVLAQSQFSAIIPDGDWAGDIIYDGVEIVPLTSTIIPAGKTI